MTPPLTGLFMRAAGLGQIHKEIEKRKREDKRVGYNGQRPRHPSAGNMPTHRVDIGLEGTSHYVDGELHGSSGFPLRGRQLPEGLRLERRVGGQGGKPHKNFVKKKGLGVSVEWTSDRV